jgi:23S rRNA maturation mini-RNase III
LGCSLGLQIKKTLKPLKMACNQDKISDFFIRSLYVSFNAFKLDMNSQQVRSFNIKTIQAKRI